MQKEEREAAIAANRQPITPEQMLNICREDKALEEWILAQRGIRTKAEILAVLKKHREQRESVAWQQIKARKWK